MNVCLCALVPYLETRVMQFLFPLYCKRHAHTENDLKFLHNIISEILKNLTFPTDSHFYPLYLGKKASFFPLGLGMAGSAKKLMFAQISKEHFDPKRKKKVKRIGLPLYLIQIIIMSSCFCLIMS